jgi:peptidoglycan/LPS O-acetylase OafA/YrhL
MPATPSTPPAGSTTAARSTRAVPALTGIRFFAALFVFIYHYGAWGLDNAGLLPQPIATLLHNGYFGVSGFFVLSGFILSHAHPAAFVHGRQYVDYLIARFGRIYPVYLLTLLVALPISLAALTPHSALSVLLMVQAWYSPLSDNGFAWVLQAWTLSVELVFYLLFPFMVTGLRRLGTPLLVGLLLLDGALLIGGGIPEIHPDIGSDDISHFPGWLLYVPLPLVRTPEFVLGVLLNILVRRMPGATAAPGVQLAPGARLAHTGLAMMLLVMAAMVAVLASTHNPHAVGAATPLVGILIALIYLSNNAITRLLGSRLLYVLGSASYALYLLEFPCHTYLLRWLPYPYGRLLELPVSIVLSVLVWHFVEEPSRRFITRLRHPDRTASYIASNHLATDASRGSSVQSKP